MSKVHILVEGQTEQEFVREVLHPHFHPRGIFLNAVVAKTKRPIGGSPAFRGGIVSYRKIEFDLKRLVHDSSASLITTMIDYYRLPSDFPGFTDEEAKTGSALQCVGYLERKFHEAIDDPRFLPYLSTHEFEALLFSDTRAIVREIRGDDEKIEAALQKVCDQYPSPEEINKDNPPSGRILKLMTEYDKIVHGLLIAVEIGIESMRQQCPHFDGWLKQIEALAAE